MSRSRRSRTVRELERPKGAIRHLGVAVPPGVPLEHLQPDLLAFGIREESRGDLPPAAPSNVTTQGCQAGSQSGRAKLLLQTMTIKARLSRGTPGTGRLQDEGSPAVFIYPSAIIGPAAGAALGETSLRMARLLALRCIPTRQASLSIIDVRDLVRIHVALTLRSNTPSRVMCGGHHVMMEELAALLEHSELEALGVTRTAPLSANVVIRPSPSFGTSP